MKLYIEDFNQKNSDSSINHVIVPHSIPIIWFGNLDKYLMSKTRVITVGLNPSNIEFSENRFDYIDLKKTSIDNAFLSLYNTLNKYFSSNPYKKWFSSCEHTVNQFNSSYYDEPHDGIINTAIHIDIYSAIATNPTWSGLDKKEQRAMERTDLFRKLIYFLNPDIILFSSNKDRFKEVFHDFDFCGEIYKKPKIKSRDYIRKYKKGNQYLYWIYNNNGTAFGVGYDFIEKGIKTIK